MTAYPVRLPDVGEGVAEAELVSWLVEVGEHVDAEAPLAEVLTDKATVEIMAPVAGVVARRVGEPGDRVAVGTELVVLELDAGAAVPVEPAHAVEATHALEPVVAAPVEPVRAAELAAPEEPEPAPRPGRALAAPAVRARARDLGIDLSTVQGSGVSGIITHADLDRLLAPRSGGAGGRVEPRPGTRVEPVIGLRRRIAERLTKAWTEIPHITIVEEVDATELEALRAELNKDQRAEDRLTLLPFVIRALTIACHENPRCNAHYDAVAGTLTLHDGVNAGIATQTDNGLVVAVVHDADRLDVRALGHEVARVSGAARNGTASTQELSGSTITITSLGALGGLVTTPLINQPEVAIIGVNKLQVRPMWRDGAFVPRTMFNLSSSFDHRIVDGYDAAVLVRRLKQLLEAPALLFVS